MLELQDELRTWIPGSIYQAAKACKIKPIYTHHNERRKIVQYKEIHRNGIIFFDLDHFYDRLRCTHDNQHEQQSSRL
jgi:hypothetical protein